ncbi:hypothetical protein ACFPRL_16420 [Pseudoclavibacter helvolus]
MVVSRETDASCSTVLSRLIHQRVWTTPYLSHAPTHQPRRSVTQALTAGWVCGSRRTSEQTRGEKPVQQAALPGLPARSKCHSNGSDPSALS